jgi:hypothetical protein
VISSSIRPGGTCVAARTPRISASRIAAPELLGREVDRDRHRREARAPPGADLARGLGEHPFARRQDEPRVLQRRDEVGRQHHAALRVVPAQQRLDPVDAAVAQVDLRAGSAARTRRARWRGRRSGVELQLRHRALVHLGGEEAVRVARELLRAVHRHVRVLQQRLGVGSRRPGTPRCRCSR